MKHSKWYLQRSYFVVETVVTSAFGVQTVYGYGELKSIGRRKWANLTFDQLCLWWLETLF